MNPLDDALEPVVAKARGHLRISTLVLASALALCAVVVVVFHEHTTSRRANFDDNSNLQVISVTHHQSDALAPLTMRDVTVITEKTQHLITDNKNTITISPHLSLGVGMEITGSQTSIQLIGIDPDMATVLGLGSMDNGVAYASEGPAGPIQLAIPVVKQQTQGIESEELAHRTLTLSPTVDSTTMAYLVRNGPSSIAYVTSETFWHIAEVMLGAERATLTSAPNEFPMIPFVEEILVHVDTIDEVRTVAAELEAEGYVSSYALQAFDEIENTLDRQRWLGVGLLLLVVMGVGAYFLLSWRSYLALSRRDIGILRHWHIPQRNIENLYGRRLTRSLLVPLFGASATLIFGSVGTLGWPDALSPLVLDVLVLIIIVLAMHTVVRRIMIPGWVRRDILQLLHSDREFQ